MDSKIVWGLPFWQLRMQEFFLKNNLHLRARYPESNKIIFLYWMYSHLQLRISFCLECSEEPPEGPLRNPYCLISVIPFAFPTLAKIWKVTEQVLFEKFCSGNRACSLSRIPPSSFPLHALQELGWKCPSRCIVKMGRRKSIVPTPGISLPLSAIFLLSLESR